LLAYFRFNQGFDNAVNTGITMLADSSGNGFNGTLSNFALTGTSSNFHAPGAVLTDSMAPAFTNSLSAVATQTNVACNGGANGAVSLTPSGYAPYFYEWFPTGGSTATESNLTAGTYTYAVGNPCGFIVQTVTITEPAPLIITATSDSIDCNGGTATVTVSATGGTANYTGTGSFTVTASSYTYTVTDANSCSATTAITITEPNPLNVSVTVNGETITSNLSGVTYQWLDCDNGNSAIAGETNQSFTAAVNGNYAVIVDNGSCADTSACVAITTVGANESDLSGVSIYPNPTQGKLVISLQRTENVSLVLKNVLGQVIQSRTSTASNRIELNIDEAAGVYFLEITNQKNQRSVVRIIKE
jgi:hypothetical protein